MNPSQNHPTQPFLDAGHYVLTFDLPHHGDRIVKDSIEATPPGAANGNIRAMSKAFTAGNDPFEQFVSDGMAAIDACLERGVARQRQDRRIRRIPRRLLPPTTGRRRPARPRRRRSVTRHRLGRPPRIRRLTPIRSAPTAALHIENWADQLADRAVYLCIGSQDDVVSTELLR